MKTCASLHLLLILAGAGQLVLCAASPFIPVILRWPRDEGILPALHVLPDLSGLLF